MAREHGPRWLKFDASYFANRKVMRAGRNGRDIFLAALCMNAHRGAHGSIPIADWEPEYLARYVGITVADAADGMSRAIAASLLAVDGDRVVIVGWDEHWSSKGKTRAEIQRDYRERSGERYRHGNAALPPNHALPIDREIDRERDAAASLSASHSDPGDPELETRSGERVSRRQATKAAGLPQDWKPSTEAVELAKQLGLDVKQETAKFADRMRSGERKSADWQAEFRNWLRRGAEFQERNGTKPKSPKPGATTTTKRRMRQTIDGVVFVENDHGELVPTEQAGISDEGGSK